MKFPDLKINMPNINTQNLHMPEWYINHGIDNASNMKDNFYKSLDDKAKPLLPYANAVNNYDESQNPWSNVNPNNGVSF